MESSPLPIQLTQVARSDAAAAHGARDDLIVGDGGALDGAADEILRQTIGAIAAVDSS